MATQQAPCAVRQQRSPKQRWFVWLLTVAALLLVGGFLRLQQISVQWLIDDEWHAVHKLINSDGVWPILTSFGHSDYSIPLTLYDKFLADTIGLSELRMRIPMLISGFAFLIAAILWAKSKFGYLIAASFGFMLAVSPLLINYSRNARPYMISLLLGAVGIWALARWAGEHRRRTDLGVYLLATWAASYLHLVMAPFLLAPLLVVLIERFSGKSSVSLRALTIASTAAVAGVLLAVGPPLLQDWSAMAAKTGSDLPDAETLQGVWYMWIGTDSTFIVLTGIVLALLGLPRLYQEIPLELAMWSAGLTGILAAIAVMQPAWVHNPVTFGRYLLPALPLILLAIASGIYSLASRLPGRVQAIAVALPTAASLFGAPHDELLRYPNNFTLHTYFQFDFRPTHNPVRNAFSSFVEPSRFWDRFTDAEPGDYLIAVAGQPSFESYFNTQPLYQTLHRQRLINLQTTGACGPARAGEAFPRQGIYLRNAVSLARPGDLESKGVDWIIIDRRMENAAAPPLRKAAVVANNQCVAYLTRRFGKPAFADDTLVAFSVTGRSGMPLDPDRAPHQ